MKTDSQFPKNANLLELVPVGKVKHFINESGKVDLLVPKFRNEKFARWFIPSWKSPFVTLHLDEQGSKIWLEINGEKNVQEICNNLDGDADHQKMERVGKFFTQLFSNGCISFREIENR